MRIYRQLPAKTISAPLSAKTVHTIPMQGGEVIEWMSFNLSKTTTAAQIYAMARLRSTNSAQSVIVAEGFITSGQNVAFSSLKIDRPVTVPDDYNYQLVIEVHGGSIGNSGESFTFVGGMISDRV